jgi:general L-amino acid transport system substrate-binding protein
MRFRKASLACIALLLALATPVQAGPRLDAVKARGTLHCAVPQSESGMSVEAPPGSGNFVGFEADLCRAVAIAIFGTPKVVFRPTTTLQEFLRSQDTDLVIRGLTWSFQREAGASIRFGPIYYHDGQSFLVRRSAGVSGIAQLSGRTICVSSDIFADFYPALERAFATRRLTLHARRTQTRAEAEAIFFAGGCDAVTADTTELASAVLARGGQGGESFLVLPEQITEEPLAPLLREGDEQFFEVVQWAIFALINAEKLGITSRNVDAMRSSADRDIQRFFAKPPAAPGFDPAWSYALVKTLGNYGELFARHIGAARTTLAVPRGLNRLPAQGGILYAPPLR